MIPEPRVAGNIECREEAIMMHYCIKPPLGCGRAISSEEIDGWDSLTQKEYAQSGWCLSCQDKIFRDPDDADGCTCNWEPCCEVDVGVGVITCGDQHRPPCDIHELPPEEQITEADLLPWERPE